MKHLLYRVGWLLPLFALLASCSSIKLVQTYDENLFNKTETFYEAASKVILRGESESLPLKSIMRLALPGSKPNKHVSHFLNFKDDYEKLIVQTNSLVLRAMLGSEQLNEKTLALHDKVADSINEKLPLKCGDVIPQTTGISLTVQSYISLQCRVIEWQKQHRDRTIKPLKGAFSEKEFAKIGKETIDGLLTQKEWYARKKALFESVLDIQKAQARKKTDKE